MADNIVGLAIGNAGDLLVGNLQADYTNNTVGGNLDLDVLGAEVPVLNLTLTNNGGGGYTIAGTTVAGTGVVVSYAGQSPTSVSATVTALGTPAVTATVTVTPSVACYCSGTRIRTSRGEVAVESLSVGDILVTTSGAHRPITWLGHRTIACSARVDNSFVWPVRIAAHAFAPGKPSRDLFVSPGHAICLDLMGNVLIPVSALINGSTIVQVEVDEVTYWHVELEDHDVVLAENLPAESYIDCGNRCFFVENGTVSIDAMPDAPLSIDDYCLPFVSSGLMVELARTRLAERSMLLGWTLHPRSLSDIRLVVDGTVLTPTIDGLAARFTVSCDAAEVFLMAATSVPAHVSVATPDCRALGLHLNGIVLDDGFERRAIALDDERLGDGFHSVEDGGARRWTAGRARLPRSLWDGCRGSFFLRLDVAGAPIPYWVAPDLADRPALAA